MSTKETIIGLDIGPKEINLVAGDIIASVPTPGGAIAGGVITDPKSVARAIKDLFKSKGIVNKNVAGAVSGKRVVLRLSDVPAMGPEAIKNIIRDEASKYIVFAGSKLITDFATIAEIEEGKNKKLKVLSVVAKKEIINSYVDTIKLAGLVLANIEVPSLAIVRAIFLKEDFSKGQVVLAAVEHDTATIFVFKDKKIHYLHNVDSLDNLDAEVESTITYCKSTFGETANIKKIISKDISDVSIAKGLALRETKEDKSPIKINLMPLEEIRIKEFNLQIIQFFKILGIIIIALILFSFFLNIQERLVSRRVNAIQGELKKPNPVIKRLIGIEQGIKLHLDEAQAQEGIIIAAHKKRWDKLLEEIKIIIPKEVRLTRLVEEKDQVIFKGEASSQEAVFNFVRTLRDSIYFTEVKLRTAKDREKDSKIYIDFNIKCQLNLKEKE